MKIYIMGNTAHTCLYKIGISKNVKNRKNEIQKTMGGRVYVIFSWNLIFAFFWEQLLHRMYGVLNAKGIRGSGKTEWFRLILPITPILWIIFFWAIELVGIGVVCLTIIKMMQ